MMPATRLLRPIGVASMFIALLAAPARPDDVVAPNSHLITSGVPPIPANLMRALAPYTEFRPRAVASWHPVRRELLVATRAANTVQLHAVDAPLGALRQLTDYAEPVRRGLFWPRRPDALVFARDTGGNEQTRLYRLDHGASQPVALTDASVRSALGALDHARRRMLVSSVPLDKTGRQESPQATLTLLDPLQPERARTLATLAGTGWGDFSFSFDDRRLALVEFKSIEDSRVHVMDVATGKLEQVLPRPSSDKHMTSASVAFAADGKHLFLATDAGGEFRRAALLSLRDGQLRYFGPEGADIEELALSPDGRTVALVVNRGGVGELAVYDAMTLEPRPTPKLPPGTVSGITWHDNSRDIAFNLNSAQSPSDVWSIDVPSARLTRWTETRVQGLDAGTFVSPAPIAWQSFDGRIIHGFITRPPARHTGRRPVLIAIHGGPEAQARPGFIGRLNYLVDELGIALVEPNVRGSSGYGRTFVSLDDGMKREDSVRDIGTLLEWIAAQPDLDASRVAVYGGSYGGYMSLAVSEHFADRIAGSVDVVGVANFVSFLEHTESYRRDLRRVEYGDERKPAMREFLTRISPVTNADKIRKPLLVAHGRNDPRVPYTEAEQIVTTVRAHDVPVWYILADNEGHGFARKDNADYFFAAMTLFLKEVLGV
ncbi:MAG TPA: prolyl oligopeptidase family serine peptidase [Casimicrobiaceae bacterium]